MITGRHRSSTELGTSSQVTAQALAGGYAAYIARGEMSVVGMFSPEFYDNVSGQRGLRIFTIVDGWFKESFAERTVQLHLVTHNDDTVMIWYTMRGQHIGSGFPRLRLEDDLVVEHWAVRDDAAMLDSVTA